MSVEPEKVICDYCKEHIAFEARIRIYDQGEMSYKPTYDLGSWEHLIEFAYYSRKVSKDYIPKHLRDKIKDLPQEKKEQQNNCQKELLMINGLFNFVRNIFGIKKKYYTDEPLAFYHGPKK